MLAGLVMCLPTPAAPLLPDHQEFDASLQVPFRGDAARLIVMQFEYPGAAAGTPVAWQISLLDHAGNRLRTWDGNAVLHKRTAQATVTWDGLDSQHHALAAGYYTVRMRAIALDDDNARRIGTGLVTRALALAEQLAPKQIEEQRYDIQVGQVAAARMPAFRGLPQHAGAHALSTGAGSLPYTIFYGNLHSQTNHSDGAGPIATCDSEQAPQSGQYGPAYAYQYAQNDGLDMLMTSEHNHMFDGSTGTNSSADPATAKALFASGLSAATTYNAAHPGFLAIYGQEWGVISNGGHMNIFNADGLIEWEKNSAGQLIGDYYIAKGDYGSLYTLMNSKGWIGQFNHPATSGQFTINGTNFGYTADGDAVMVMAEVLNSSAFSHNTTETETSRPNYEAAFNTILERGYHVAPSSDQDNHCSNWGASFTNRTGVLIPTGTALSMSSFLDALRARRAFATEDKAAQIVLTANGHLMGERFSNGGPLTLTVNYASSNGQTAQLVQVFEGVPGSNGTVDTLSETAVTTTTPTVGDHFYYAKITEANGLRLWSAPVWVSEGSGSGDTTPPTVTASESGSSGTVTFNASASDNIGVTRVEFYVDGVLKSSDTSSPYSATLDSTTLANGSHALVAKAYDAAGNVGSSSSVSFSVSNSSGGGGDTTPPTASASESGSSGSITFNATASDNVGVSRVDFYVDGALKGSDASSPYSMTLDSTTLANGSHALLAKAYDAAGNIGSSSAVNFTISNSTGGTQLISNGGFESGASIWTQTSGAITSSSSEPAHAGSWKAWLDGYGTARTDYVRQKISIPTGVSNVTLDFFLHVDTAEPTTKAYDNLQVQVITSNGKTINLATFSNMNAASGYQEHSLSLNAYKGQTLQISFSGTEDNQLQTSFVIDDVSVTAQ